MAVFTPALFAFLRDLAANNDRVWFTANRARFEADVKKPLHACVHALAPKLAVVDAEARCDDRSVFRIHRDTRFSKDKAPYKTHAAAQFARGAERGPSATGYYLHLEPGNSFFAGGLWLPEPAVAGKIRVAIDTHPDGWTTATRAAGGLDDGPTLARVPKPFPADHPLAEDLRRKSFTARVCFTDEEVVADDFVERIAAAAARIAPLVRFVAAAAR